MKHLSEISFKEINIEIQEIKKAFKKYPLANSSDARFRLMRL